MKLIAAILIFNVAFVLGSAVRGWSQTVSPLVVECGRKCSGSFVVTNEGVQPMAVVVEPFSFSLSHEGNSLFRALDKTVEVQLNEMTARIGPHSEHEFDYSMRCSAEPCLVALTTGMIVGHTEEGIAIRLVIPHIVYQCSKGKDCRKSVRLAAGLPN